MKKAKASIPQMVELYLQGLEPDEIKEELGYSSAEYITQKLRDAKVYDSSRKRIDKENQGPEKSRLVNPGHF